MRVSSVSGELWRRTSRVELGARGVRGEERDGRGCGERESLRGGDNLIDVVRCVGRCGRRAGDEGGAADAAALASATLAGRAKGRGEPGGDARWMPYRAVSWRGASIEWRCRGGKGEHVIASALRPPAGLLDSHRK